MTEQELKLLYDKGMWVSDISERSLKEKLFDALYQGPVKESTE